MVDDELLKKIKLVIIIALIIGVIGAVIFLVYGFALMWQAMAATVMIIFLAIATILFLALSIYLWIKNWMLKKELDKQWKELEKVSHNLKNCNRRLRVMKSANEE
ncbi:MAG: hypothetical protein ABFC12_01930 [Methanobacterium sp.]